VTDYEIIFDGGSKSNPGLGYGSFAIFFADEIVIHEELVFGDGVTNNEAEYRTLIEGLKRLLLVVGDEAKNTGVTVFGDSQLVINQVTGRWKIKKPELLVLRNRAVELLNRFGKAEAKWHSRVKSVSVLGH
jgi:ribonuclease HI